MGCLELFLSEVSSGVLAPLKDGLALRPVSRQFCTFFSVVPLSLALSLLGQRPNDRTALKSERVFVFPPALPPFQRRDFNGGPHFAERSPLSANRSAPL